MRKPNFAFRRFLICFMIFCMTLPILASCGDPAETTTAGTTATDGIVTVTFQNDDGTVIAVKRFQRGAQLTAPSAPTRESYDFLGWSDGTTIYSAKEIGKMTALTDRTFRAVLRENENFNTLFAGNVTSERIKPVHGVGAGPLTGWFHTTTTATEPKTETRTFGDLTYTVTETTYASTDAESAAYVNASDLFRNMKAPFVRLHDIETPFGRDAFVDVHCVCTSISGGEGQYTLTLDFSETDAYIDAILAANPGTQIIYRLGESIGANVSMNPYAIAPGGVNAPYTQDEWATIALAIVDHYQSSEKYRDNVRWFEIWNEPDLYETVGGVKVSQMWANNDAARTYAGMDLYYSLYRKTAALIKDKWGDAVNVGGPGLSGSAYADVIAHLSDAPIDFFSYHRYATNSSDSIASAGVIRRALDQKGLYMTSVIYDEWNYVESWNNTDQLTGIVSPAGVAYSAAQLIDMQHADALDIAVYYDAGATTGGYNGVYYAPYLDMLYDPRIGSAVIGAYFGEKALRGEFTGEGNDPAAYNAALTDLLGNEQVTPVKLPYYYVTSYFAKLYELGYEMTLTADSHVSGDLLALGAANFDGSDRAIMLVNRGRGAISFSVDPGKGVTAYTLSRVQGISDFRTGVTGTETPGTCDGKIALTLAAGEVVLIEYRTAAPEKEGYTFAWWDDDGSAVFTQNVQPTTKDALQTAKPTKIDRNYGAPVEFYQDFIYGTRGDATTDGAVGRLNAHRSGQYYDIYKPENVGEDTPVLLYVHGGSWSQLYDKGGEGGLLLGLAARGYLVVTMNYILQNDLLGGKTAARPDATFAAMVRDIDDMVTYLHDVLLPAFGVSTDNAIAIGGTSAGGHLSSLYAYDQDADEPLGLDLAHKLTVGVEMNDVGAVDLGDMMMNMPLMMTLGVVGDLASGFRLFAALCGLPVSADPAARMQAMKRWSATRMIGENAPYSVIAYCELFDGAGSDGCIPTFSYERLCEKLTACGVPHDNALFVGIQHGQIDYSKSSYPIKGTGTSAVPMEWVWEKMTAAIPYLVGDPE